MRSIEDRTHDRNVKMMVSRQINARDCEIESLELIMMPDSGNPYPSDVMGILRSKLKYGGIFMARAALARTLCIDTDGEICIQHADELRIIKLETIADYWNEHTRDEADSLAG